MAISANTRLKSPVRQSDAPSPVGDRLKERASERIEEAKDSVSALVPDELSLDVHFLLPLHPDAGRQVRDLKDFRLKDLPEVIKETKDSIRQVIDSILNDNPLIKRGEVVPYPEIPEEAKAAAKARATVPAVRQPLISGSKDPQKPSYNEPVSLIVKGTEEQLVSALKEAGWMKADEKSFLNNLKMGLSAGTGLMDYPEGPVSDQYLNGQRHLMAFNKNVDSNNSRDHLRIWPIGKNEWAIAASRDSASIAWIDVDVRVKRDGWKPDIDLDTHFRSSHLIDPYLDGERDLIMVDLLSTGRVRTWEMVPGKRTSAEEEALAKRQYQTDGYVYLVDLTAKPKPPAS